MTPPNNSYHIHNGILIDGRGGDPLYKGEVLIQSERIVAVGQNLEVPNDAIAIDAAGGGILPGLIDAHVHVMFSNPSIMHIMSQPFSLQFYEAAQNLERSLMAGLTSLRDAGGADLGVKQALQNGLITGSRLQISITVMSITGGHVDFWQVSGSQADLFVSHPGRPDGIADGVDEVRRKTREILRAGADVIKICTTGGVLSPTDHPEFTQFSPEEIEVVVQEAAFRRGVKVMAHAQGAEGVKNAIRAGVHSIEHGIYLDEEAIDLMLEHGTFLVPTLLAPVAVIEVAEQTGSIPAGALAKAKESLEAHSESIARAYKAGVKIAMGTDAGVMPHGTNLRELGLMADVGMSPMHVLESTTRIAAECLGWQDEIGTLEAGKLADVVITRGNPLDDIHALADNDNVPVVMQGGQVVKNRLAT